MGPMDWTHATRARPKLSIEARDLIEPSYLLTYLLSLIQKRQGLSTHSPA